MDMECTALYENVLLVLSTLQKYISYLHHLVSESDPSISWILLYEMEKRFLDDVSIYHKTAAAGLSWGLFDSKSLFELKKIWNYFFMQTLQILHNCHVFSILLFSQTWKNLVILKKNWHVKNMSYTFLTLLVHLPTTYIHISPLKFSLSSCLLDFLSEKKVSYMQAILMTWMFNGKKALLAKLAFWMVNFLLGTIVERGNEECAGKAKVGALESVIL